MLCSVLSSSCAFFSTSAALRLGHHGDPVLIADNDVARR